MHTKRFGRYPRHRRIPLRRQWQFLGLSFLSCIAVFVIAMLSRAELRLSGNTLAANGDDLAIMEQLQPFKAVELIRQTPELRLYLLTRDDQHYLAHVKKDANGAWEIAKVERVHR